MFTIKRAAEQVGISASTLRSWERRYGIVTPSRTEGGYRLYDEADLRALSLMARLVEDGWTPSTAATEAIGRLETVSGDTTASDARLAPAVPASPTTGPGLPSPSADTLAAAMLAAAAALDAAALSVVLDEMFTVGSFESVVDHHLLPAMHALGQAWASGRVSVAAEHLGSHAVMRRLGASFEAAASFGNGPRVLVGLAPGCRHEVGLFAFAVAARRRGIATDYLGADLPVADWVDAVATRDPAAIVLAVSMAADLEATQQVVTAVHDRHPHLVIAVGGHEQDLAPRDVERLGHGIGTAAAALAQTLTGHDAGRPAEGAAGRATRTHRRA
ncbi:MAG: MerR family transcriptional regulator [Intrasporangium sp.]|uniref:MerR family transcriptional regulator n=1 Tax=Intrasporangium sp. TaxID=1925024 RepID=UPI002648F716|nr:MerR family transcriptional regulator [Intrasporangium sp.]MDN5798284.1 MerR family transcriptional regulator [Intrasporangium sp.]